MAKHPKFEVFTDRGGKKRFRLTAKNGQTILSSQGYSSKESCMQGVESVRKNAPLDERYERKEDSGGQFMFNLKAANAQVIGTSEAYTSASSRDKGIESVKTNGPVAEVEET